MRIRMGRVGEAKRAGAALAAAWPLLLLALGMGACRKPSPAPTTTAQAPAAEAGAAPRVELGAAAQLDSGNAAFKVKEYRGALAHYRAAADRQPSLAAAWFGVYMAEKALGNAAGADSAMRRVQALAPGTMGAHPANADSTAAGALPPGHPGATPGMGAGTLPPGPPALPGAPTR